MLIVTLGQMTPSNEIYPGPTSLEDVDGQPLHVSPSIRKSHTGIARETKLNKTVYYFQIISRVEGRQGTCDDRAEQ